MSVIAEFQVPAADFELGRILAVEGVTSIELESLVPTGEATVPLFWVHNTTREPFLDGVQHHPAVNDVAELEVFEDRTLFSLDWDARQDHLFAGITTHEGQLLRAVGTPSTWEFELRFPDNDSLGEFTTHCEHAGISLTVSRVYNPTDTEAEPWFGLTDPQREALRLAVERGYYDIPRGCTTEELSRAMGISDQAVTERLRRAIATLVRNTLLPDEGDH